MDRVKTVSAAYRLYAAFVFSLLVAACYPSYYPTTIPIDTLHFDAPAGDHQQLFIFLPGNGDPVSAFYEHGLVQAVRQRGLSIDMIGVNAHLGYYMEGTVITRLKQDVIDPAKARGYKNIWLVGNSLGGFGSISYARQYPQDITGVILLGPFLGERKTANEIREAGGLQKWEPEDIGNNSQTAWEKQLWLWLRDHQQQEEFWRWIKECEQKEGCSPKIYLGYGRNDRFSYGQKLLAEVLPPQRVVVIRGGHNWTTWKELWDIFLDRLAVSTPVNPSQALQN